MTGRGACKRERITVLRVGVNCLWRPRGHTASTPARTTGRSGRVPMPRQAVGQRRRLSDTAALLACSSAPMHMQAQAEFAVDGSSVSPGLLGPVARPGRASLVTVDLGPIRGCDGSSGPVEDVGQGSCRASALSMGGSRPQPPDHSSSRPMKMKWPRLRSRLVSPRRARVRTAARVSRSSSHRLATQVRAMSWMTAGSVGAVAPASSAAAPSSWSRPHGSCRVLICTQADAVTADLADISAAFRASSRTTLPN